MKMFVFMGAFQQFCLFFIDLFEPLFNFFELLLAFKVGVDFFDPIFNFFERLLVAPC